MANYEHRKSSVVLQFTDRAGVPVAGKTVNAELRKHEFLFGTGAFFSIPITSGAKSDYYDRLWSEWNSTFNYGTIPFYLGRYEPEQGKPMQEETLRAAKFLHEAGKSVKGHPLVWHTVTADWMHDMPTEKVLEYQLYRIRREIGAFRPYLRFWDVINEVVIMPEFVNEPSMNPVTRLCRETGRVPLVKKVFDQASACDGEATLLINDFNTSERYASLIRDCLDAGVKISAIGIQSHQHQGFWGMEKLCEVEERFEKFGLPIHYTENTFVSGHLMPPEIVDLNDYQIPEWPSTPEGEDRQARDLMTMMEYLFDRPLVKAFTTWDFEDHQWLGAPSGLIRKDGSPKPALLALQEKLRGDWHTNVSMVTDANGVCTLTGFRGEYELRVDGKIIPASVTEASEPVTIILD